MRDELRNWIALHRPGSKLAVLFNPGERKEFAVQAPLPIHQRPTAIDGLAGAIPFGIAGVALAAIDLRLQNKKEK